jgi:hypothetical protein
MAADFSQELQRVKARVDDRASLDKKLQILLALQYRDRIDAGRPPLALSDVEFRTFSQNGEDGIIHYIFSVIGAGGRRVVEMCAADGMECNAANLIINHGWKGLLVDGREEFVSRGRTIYGALSDTFIRPPTFAREWITAENVNEIVRRHGFDGDLDLLSLDLDGVDYWVWKALACVQPRVVVLEYNAIWSAARAVTIPYRPDFQMDFSRVPFYHGASLAAFVKLGREKGYRLVGCERSQTNAIFVRSDVAPSLFPEVPPEKCLSYTYDGYDWGEREWIQV